MYHKTNLGRFGESLPCDIDGYVPEAGDDWRDMNWDLGQDDPDADDLSTEERKQRTAYLDDEWWPAKIAEAGEATAAANVDLAEWQQAD